MKRLFRIIFLLLTCSLLSVSYTCACDYCGIYTPMDAREVISRAWNFSVSETLLGYGKIRDDGKQLQTNRAQNLKLNITELYGSYDFSDMYALEAALPFVNARYTRLKNGETRKGSKTGLGDIALYARAAPYQSFKGPSEVLWQFFAGVTFPTGNTSALDDDDNPDYFGSAVYGHDITLGSGAVNVPMGTAAVYQVNFFRFEGALQYNLRTKGAHSYQYANDLRYNFTAGYVITTAIGDITPKFVLSGLTKGRDTHRGKAVEDSGLNEMLIGPAVEATIFDRLTAALLIEFPVLLNNNGTQALQDHLVRLELSYRL